VSILPLIFKNFFKPFHKMNTIARPVSTPTIC
jgi:hypothetical protein